MSNSPEPLRIGIVGAGAIVRDRHLPNLKKIEGIEVAAVCNSTLDSASTFCRQHAPEAEPMENWADLLARPDLDIIWIGTPPSMHASVTIAALQAGKHVFCQARMASHLAEAEDMLYAAQKFPHLVTMLCPPPHGMVGEQEMQQRLSAVGQPHHIRLRSLTNSYIDPDTPAHWRQKYELSGIQILTLGIYVEVLHRWLGQITQVYAQSKLLTPLRGEYRVRIPDMVTVFCEFESGAHGVLEFGGIHAHPPGDSIEIYGDQGTLTYDFVTDTIQLGTRHENSLQPITISNPGSWRVEEDFIRAVRQPGAPRPSPTFEEGLAYMRVVQAVTESLTAKHPIVITH